MREFCPGLNSLVSSNPLNVHFDLDKSAI